MSRNIINTKLLSVIKKNDHYEISVSFGLNIIHGILTETMNFKQKEWPDELAYWVDRTIDVPFFVSCDSSQLTYDYKEVRDGYEYWDVIVGCHGRLVVLGHTDTKSEFKVKFHKYGGVSYINQYDKDPNKVHGRKVGAYLKFSLSSPHKFVQDRYYKGPFARKVYESKDLVDGQALTQLDHLILRAFRKDFYHNKSKVRSYPPNYTQYYTSINLNQKKYLPYMKKYQEVYIINYLKRCKSINEKNYEILTICGPTILDLLTHGVLKVKDQGYRLNPFHSNS
jgi:hypothetical protein